MPSSPASPRNSATSRQVHSLGGLPSGAPPLHVWQPGREAALARLAAFVPHAGHDYARSRNYDLGPQARSNISALSPWLRHRSILEEEVLGATLRLHDPEAAEAFIREVFWRGYFKGWLQHNPAVWQRYKDALVQQIDSTGAQPTLRRRYEAAMSGQTGIECFDAWADELRRTGYLHNHARMWFASIWIYTLQLPWELGADFFLRHLLDGDAASNTCSWRWIGGLHTRGKTYLARASNIDQYTLGRFQTPDKLAGDAPPLGEPDLPPARLPAFPEALPEKGKFALLVTEEDLSAETLPLPAAPDAVFILTTPSNRSPGRNSDLVNDFVSGLIADASERARLHFAADIIPLTGDWPSSLERAAAARDIHQVVTSFLPIGPANDRIRAGWPASLSLLEVVRPYDRAVWPHARAGFFALRKEIPRLIEALLPPENE